MKPSGRDHCKALIRNGDYGGELAAGCALDLIAFLFEVLGGEIEGFHERGERLLLIMWPKKIGGADENGDAMNRIVERSRDEDLLFDRVESVVASAEGRYRFLLCSDGSCETDD